MNDPTCSLRSATGGPSPLKVSLTLRSFANGAGSLLRAGERLFAVATLEEGDGLAFVPVVRGESGCEAGCCGGFLLRGVDWLEVGAWVFLVVASCFAESC